MLAKGGRTFVVARTSDSDWSRLCLVASRWLFGSGVEVSSSTQQDAPCQQVRPNKWTSLSMSLQNGSSAESLITTIHH